MDRQISVPIKKEDAVSLRAGDYVTLTGTIYTARDAAHKRMQEAMDLHHLPAATVRRSRWSLEHHFYLECQSMWRSC